MVRFLTLRKARNGNKAGERVWTELIEILEKIQSGVTGNL